MPLDIEKFIEAVERRPPLYNNRLKEYADRNLKNVLWSEIYEQFIDKWTEISEKEKQMKGQELQKKWRNLRTCFKREYAAQKNIPSGSGAVKRRKYIYFDQLLFLRESVEYRDTTNSLEQREISDSENEDDELSVSVSNSVDSPISQQKRKKKTPNCNYEEALLEILRGKKSEETEVDEDRYFLLSLLPQFKKFDEEQKFQARSEIMSTMRRIRLSGNCSGMEATNYQLQHTNRFGSAQHAQPPTPRENTFDVASLLSL